MSIYGVRLPALFAIVDTSVYDDLENDFTPLSLLIDNLSSVMRRKVKGFPMFRSQAIPTWLKEKPLPTRKGGCRKQCDYVILYVKRKPSRQAIKDMIANWNFSPNNRRVITL